MPCSQALPSTCVARFSLGARWAWKGKSGRQVAGDTLDLSLPELMDFKLFGKTILAVKKSSDFFGQSTWEVRSCPNHGCPFWFGRT